jgi:uncharacterized membrane protein
MSETPNATTGDPAAKKAKKPDIAFIAQFGLLAAIEAIFCFTPLGSIPITPAIVATLAGVPIIVTAIVLGLKAGFLMGFLAGVFSTIIWTFMPPQPLLAYIFSPFAASSMGQGLAALFVSNVPRILVGVIAALSYQIAARFLPYKKGSYNDLWAYGISGFLGSMANTIFVLGAIYIFFKEPYAAAYNVPADQLALVLAGVVATNGMLEALVCVVSAIFICRPVKLLLSKRARG